MSDTYALPCSHVYVIDDDRAIRDSLSSLLRSVGHEVATFPAVQAFLEAELQFEHACLILDVRLRGTSGLDFQQQLCEAGRPLPVIFITGFGDVPMSVRAMKAGAVDFLQKPYRDQDLLDAVSLALTKAQQLAAQDAELERIRAQYSTLTPREREVMAHAVDGLMNKQIAALLGISEITVKIHRGNAMRKMSARTFADLVKAGQRLKLSGEIPSLE